MRLTLKIPLVLITVAVVPLGLLAAFYYFGAKSLLERQALSELESIVRIQEKRVEDVIDGYKGQVVHTAELSDLRAAWNDYAGARTPAAKQAAKNALARGVARAKQDNEQIMHVHVLDGSGKVISSTLPHQDGQVYTPNSTDPVAQAFFKGRGTPDVSTLYKATVADKNARKGYDVRLLAAAPMINAADAAVVVVEVHLQKLFAIFEEHAGLGQTGEWSLVARHASGDALVVVPGRFDTNPSSPLETTFSKQNLQSPTIQALAKREQLFSGLVDYRGVVVLAATRYLPTTDWGLAVKMSEAEAYAPIGQLRDLLSTAAALLLAFTVVISIYFARSIIRPVRHLAQIAHNLAQGKLSQRAKVASQDEIGLLAGALNTMAERLEDMYDQLEGKVDAKTIELADKVRDLQRTQGAMLNLVEDLSEEKLSLEQEKSKAQAIVENIGEGIIVTNIQGVVMFMNQAAEEILGVGIDDVHGKPATDILKLWDFGGVMLPPNKHPFSVVAATGEKQATAASYRRPDGSSSYVAVIGTPIIVQGKMVGTIGAFRDVTEQQAIERAKSEFVTLASHQLRTPISAIAWLSEMLLQGDAGELTEEQREHVEQIYHSNQRTISMINQMLTISAIDLHNLPVKPEPMQLSKLTHEVIQMQVAHRKDTGTAKVKENYDTSLPDVLIDKDIINLILQSLISNALKYTPVDGNISVEVTTTSEKLNTQSKGSICIIISDNGYGIPRSARNKIFTKFFRAENIKMKDTDGTGLGLYITAELLRYVGGRISFETAEGKGSTFIALLPLEGMALHTPEASQTTAKGDTI